MTDDLGMSRRFRCLLAFELSFGAAYWHLQRYAMQLCAAADSEAA